MFDDIYGSQSKSEMSPFDEENKNVKFWAYQKLDCINTIINKHNKLTTPHVHFFDDTLINIQIVKKELNDIKCHHIATDDAKLSGSKLVSDVLKQIYINDCMFFDINSIHTNETSDENIINSYKIKNPLITSFCFIRETSKNRKQQIDSMINSLDLIHVSIKHMYTVVCVNLEKNNAIKYSVMLHDNDRLSCVSLDDNKITIKSYDNAFFAELLSEYIRI
jgi:hypothetical protein